MKKPQFAAALLTGLLTAALVLGCGAGPDTPKEPEPQKPKITLNYETVKLEITLGDNPYKGEDIPISVAKRDRRSEIVVV